MLAFGGATGPNAASCMRPVRVLARDMSVFRKSLLASHADDMSCDSMDGLVFGCCWTDGRREIGEVDLAGVIDEHEPRLSLLESEFIVTGAFCCFCSCQLEDDYASMLI